MGKMMKIKTSIDILMTISLLLLMSYGLLGEEWHEWIGVGMFLLFVVHHVLNRKWIGNLKKGTYTPFRIVQTVLVIGVMLTMLGSMFSGILLSRYVFTFVDVSGVDMFARNVHTVCGYWNFVLISLHLGLHWCIFVGIAGKKCGEPSATRAWSVRLTGAVITAYGIYAFFKRAIGTYMFLQVHFVFFDYDESIWLFLLDYLAVMGLFVFIGHYVGCILKLKKSMEENRMKILFINGSPNKNGNTAALAKEMLSGKEYETLHLVDYKIGSFGQKFEEDQLDEVIAAVKAAEVIVIGSPLYWHNICGSVRNVLDRFYGLVENGELHGRKCYFLFQGASPEKWMLEAGEYTMKRFADLYGMEWGGMATDQKEAKVLGKSIS